MSLENDFDPSEKTDLLKEERFWAAMLHIAPFSAYIVPLAGFIVPLVIWMIKKDQMPLVRSQGWEVLNFWVTVLFLYVLCVPLILLLGLGLAIAFLVSIFSIVFPVVGAIKIMQRESFRYPFTLRIFSERSL